MKTASEQLFEEFCTRGAIPITRLDPAGQKTADYEITLEGSCVFVEVKEFTPNAEELQALRDFEEKHVASWGSDKYGNRVRQKIDDAKDQLKRLCRDQYAGLLLLYDARPSLITSLDPEEILYGMYGSHAIEIHFSEKPDRSIRWGRHVFGKGKTLRYNHNTFISAVGVLRNIRATNQLHVEIYHNIYAAVPLPLEPLLRRKDMSFFTIDPQNPTEYRGWSELVLE